LERKIPEGEEEAIEAFMLNDSNITEIIKSRDDLSSCGVDGSAIRLSNEQEKKE
jgi:hypothetical protein